ncbi:MAG: T9SS type A sorting domain-containing protein [Bacteroidetes bacterium]|nr:T9SS type A sorting domain-containing protein [Bacteroidota bacterium]
MRALLLTLAVISFSLKGLSQTILHTEDFESGSSGVLLNTLDLGSVLNGENPWTVNNIYIGGLDLIPCVPPLPLFVPPTPPQPAGITNFPNSTYLHVTPQAALDIGGLLPAASYVTADGLCLFGGASTFSGMSSDISTIGQDSVTFDLWWMCGGSTLYYGEVYYSTDGGLGWTPVINPQNGTTQWIDQVTWTNTILTDPNWDNQATLRFGFRFVSGATTTGTETNPGFAIDDIAITGYDICTPTASTINPEVCFTYTSPSGNYTWTNSNTYSDTIQNVEGCDSVITINLVINTVDISVNQSGTILESNATGAAYQWQDCGNGHIAVTLATNQTFAPAYDGDFAVEVTQHGCVDTSDCFTVSGVGLYESTTGSIVIQPNPAHDFITLETGPLSSGQIVITDVSGRVVLQVTLVSGSTQISVQGLKTEGTYFVKILSADGTIVGVEKLVLF